MKTEPILNWKSESSGRIRLSGVADRTLHWVTEHQLTDPTLWARFVNQFRVCLDTENNGWRGEYWGKMMRGAVMVCQYTADEELHAILTDTVRDLLTAQAADGGFSSYRPGTGFRHWDMWCRKYIMLGLEHYLEICTDDALRQEILAALCRHADAILAAIGERSEGKLPITETSGIYGGMNSASILEPMVRLCRITGEQRYLDFARHILASGGCRGINIFALAYADEIAPHAYGVNKAYEMMSCFEGLLEYYELTGDVYYRDAAIRFAKQVMATDVTVIGCCGTVTEFFDHSAVRQTEIPKGVLQETCVSVTWMKLCRRLFAVSGEVCFLDAIEETYYNAYLSTLNTEGKHARNDRLRFLDDAVQTLIPFDSYSPLIPGVRGEETGGAQKLEDGSYYGCCAAIAAAGAAIFPQSLLWRDAGGERVLLAMYERGEAETVLPDGNRLRLHTETAYPAANAIRLTLHLDAPARFAFGLRIPAWSRETRLTCNGEVIAVTAGITYIEREWQEGDVLELITDDRILLQTAPIYESETLYRVDWSDGSMYPETVFQTPEAKRYVCFRQGALTLACDRRSGRDPQTEIRGELHGGQDVAWQPISKSEQPYPCMRAVKLQLPQEELILTDYASAGRLWSEESKSAAWIPTERENR